MEKRDKMSLVLFSLLYGNYGWIWAEPIIQARVGELAGTKSSAFASRDRPRSNFARVLQSRNEIETLAGIKFPVMLKPKSLLHLEGAAVLLAACILYHQLHGGWLWFALLFLAPDLSMAGYLGGKIAGTIFYNCVHTYVAPLLAFSVLWLTGQAAYFWLILIWLAHIGMDRMIGYGLKYETAFKDTHLQRV